jgi:hypothetical protein
VGGAQGWWLIGWRGSALVMISSSDATATTPIFTVSGSDLQMQTTTGALQVTSALLV